MTSSDVTEIYTLYKQQLNYVLVMSMICATVIASVLLIVVWLLLLPLRRINEGTRQIAQEIIANDCLKKVVRNFLNYHVI